MAVETKERPGQTGTQIGTKVEEKLFNVRFVTDESSSHLIVVDSNICRDLCKDKPCTFFCPVSVYKWEELAEKISVSYEKCVECGACRIGCSFQNIQWRYPRGGFGIQYKNG